MALFLGVSFQGFLIGHTSWVFAVLWVAQPRPGSKPSSQGHQGTLYQQQPAKPFGQLGLLQPLVCPAGGEKWVAFVMEASGSQELEDGMGGRGLATWT